MNDTFEPTPYSAEQIRASCPAGTRLIFDVVQGGEASVLHMDFVHADADGARTRSQPLGEAAVEESSASWEELRDHARFPSQRTSVTGSEVEVPAGTFSTTRYRVEGEDGTSTEFHFAKDIAFAGPPVHMVMRDASGAVRYQMSLRERTRVSQ